MLVAVSIFCFIIKIINTKYSMGQLWGMGGLALLAIVVTVCSRDDEILAVAVLLMALKDTDLQIIIEIWTYVYGIIFIGTILYSLFLQENIAMYAVFRPGRGYELRYCLGFHHPNSLQGIFLKIVCGVLLLHHNWKYYVLLFAGNLFLYFITHSRAGALATAVVIFGIAIIRSIKKRKFTFKFIRNIEMISTLVITLGTIALTYLYNHYIWISLIDRFLSGRIRWANTFANWMRISLFGSPLPIISAYGERVDAGGIAFDCGVPRTLLSYGIVVFCMLIIAYLFSIYFFWKEQHIIESIIIMGCLIYATCENAFGNPLTNMGLLLGLYFVVWKNAIKEKAEIVEE